LKDNAGVRDRWFCYLLECADGTFYAGISNALDRRLAMHSQGVASKYTRTRLPVKLVYLEPQGDRASASRRELQIKKMSRARKRALVDVAAVEPSSGSARLNAVQLQNSVTISVTARRGRSLNG